MRHRMAESRTQAFLWTQQVCLKSCQRSQNHALGQGKQKALTQPCAPAPKDVSGRVCQPGGGGSQPAPSWRTQPQCAVSPRSASSGKASPAATAATA